MARALVVYESMFGNTRSIAEAIAGGVASRLPVEPIEVSSAPTWIPEDVTLVIVGGPTHALGLSRPKTREDASRQASGSLVSSGSGLREWLASVNTRPNVDGATFDTRIDKPRIPGSAAKAAERRLRRIGFRILAQATSFYVTGTQGPLLAGELDRARRWGESVVASTQVSTDTTSLRGGV